MDSIYKNKIQRLCLPPEEYFPEGLYLRGSGCICIGEGIHGKSAVRITAGGTVSFDTYFNMFPLFKWLHYTRLSDIGTDILMRGHIRLSLMGINREEPDKEILLSEMEASSSESMVISLFRAYDASGLPDFLYVKAEALGADAVIEDIIISTDTVRDESLNMACCFCTYKREKEITRNINNLLKGIVHDPSSRLYGRLNIYAADNGRSLPDSLFKGESAVHIYPNKNYGGSAGFTRCMIESCLKHEGMPFSHIMLMDDDALIVPDAVERTADFLSILKSEYSAYMIGGARFDIDRPQIQDENGGFTDIRTMTITLGCSGTDMLVRRNIINNEAEPDTAVNYNGWFCCSIPAGTISMDNLPLPMFIHDDDIEYSIRNGGHIIRLGGICVWHPYLSLNKLKPYMEYYNFRNHLIVQSMHCPDNTAFNALFQLMRDIVKNAVNYQYQAVWYVCKGAEDFYRGIGYFKNLDSESLNLMLVNNSSFEHCRLSKEELKGINSHDAGTESNAGIRKIKKVLTWFVPAYKGRVIYSGDISWSRIDIFGAKEICVVDPLSGEGLIFKKSYKKVFGALISFISTAFMILRKHRRVYKEWHDGIFELTKYKFWRDCLKLK